ncbi:MAG TPA: diguanylate cyclase [Solirubrobacteraceae bacterium]|nr:diguanylate cyclase [Solirubrobacteraceae bacterium]
MVVFAAYLAVALGLGGSDLLDVFSTWVYIALVLGAAVLLALRGFARDDRRAPWLALALGAAMWAIGELIYELAYSEAPELAPYPSVADAFWLGSYVAVGTGIVLVLRSRLRRAFHVTMWLDAAIGATTVAALAATLAFDPVLTDTAGAGLEVATDLAYPLADLGLLALVVTLLALTGWRPGLGWAAFAIALSLQAISDVLYAREIALGTAGQDTLLAPVWPAATLLLAYAAWRPLDVSTPRSGVPLARVFVFPALFTALALGLLIYDQINEVNTLAVVLATSAIALAVARMAVSFVDNVRMLRRARLDALTDALTGLPNRRAFMEDLEGALVGGTEAPPRLLALFDLDGFKRYNDAYGHPAGDALLQRLSGALSDAIEDHGRAYRLGGDEFCLLLDDDTADEVLRSAGSALEARGDGFDVTASYGRVRLPEDAHTADEALHLADRRMYAAKEARPSSAGLQTRTVLLKVLSEREPDLLEHSTDVMALARGVARRLGLSLEERDNVARAAELHDIGKMAIPDAILNKPGPLDEREWRFMRRHTIIGEDILSVAPALQPVAALVRASHERWDGNGYPDGTAGDEIPQGARIVAVCDAFSAMVQERPYQPGLTLHEAVEEIVRCAGTHFDPDVVAAFAAEIRSEAVHA